MYMDNSQHNSDESNASKLYQHMNQLETKINIEIGFRFWNKYVSAAFWSNISLPVNLSITMLTALSTGQATTDNLLPKNLYVNISVATLVISVLNTYFRPHIQMNKNLEMMNKWNILGCEFEEIYYSEKSAEHDLERRIAEYDVLMHKINDLKKNENLETQNFVTDIIYGMLRSCSCFKHQNSWLALEEKLKKNNAEGEKDRTYKSQEFPSFRISDFYADNSGNINIGINHASNDKHIDIELGTKL